MFWIILIGLGVLLILALSTGLILGWAMGLGWLLSRLVSSLTLFEATLLALLPTLLFAHRLLNMLSEAVTSYGESRTEEDEPPDLPGDADYFVDEDAYPIPLSQLTKGKRPVGEDIVLLEFANGIYIRLTAEGKVGFMGDAQVQQLAIRLAEFAVKVVKSKRSGQLKVSMTALKKQMEKDGQRPYDTDILHLAADEVNELLDGDEDVIMVTRSKAWRLPYI
jgi:hypothetical protein